LSPAENYGWQVRRGGAACARPYPGILAILIWFEATNVNLTYLLLGLALGWGSLALVVLLYRGIRERRRQRRYGMPVDYGSLLVEYGRRMTAALDRRQLLQLMTVELPGVLEASRAALLLPQDHRLVAVDEDAGDLSLAVSHAAVRWVASAGEAQRADRGRLDELIQQGRTDLAWTRVWVPLMRGLDLRGLWVLGERQGGALRYANEDLRWLTVMGRQAAIVLEALHHAEQERWAADEMRALYRQMVTAREGERGRIARELHDGVLQDLCAVTRDLRAAEVGEVAGGAVPFADLVARSGEAVRSLRAICNDLRPPLLQQDLVSALKALVEGLDARSAAPIALDVTADALNLSDDTALVIFRITQEALHNALQHADASEIAVRLTQYPDRLRLTVTDDGRGITGGLEPGRFVAQGHFGLAGMRERAAMIGAKLDVQTAVEYGTAVILELPL
jgi:signal transduction histidine kinase